MFVHHFSFISTVLSNHIFFHVWGLGGSGGLKTLPTASGASGQKL